METQLSINSSIDPTPRTAEISFNLGTKLDEIERIAILETLKQQGFNRTRAAIVLGIGIRTLQRKLKKYSRARTA